MPSAAIPAGAVGQVVQVRGDVYAESGQETRSLTEGSPVYQGDTLVTGKDAGLEVVFVDNTSLSQSQESVSRVDSYVYDPDAPSNSDLLFQMSKGVFRTVTGEIAEQNPDHFQLKSPLATIGIRGTTVVSEVRDLTEKHGVEDIGEGKVLVVKDAMGNIQFIDNPKLIIDFFQGQAIRAARPLSADELAFFQTSAPLTVLGEEPGEEGEENGDGEDDGQDGEEGEGDAEEEEGDGEEGDGEDGEDVEGDAEGEDGELDGDLDAGEEGGDGLDDGGDLFSTVTVLGVIDTTDPGQPIFYAAEGQEDAGLVPAYSEAREETISESRDDQTQDDDNDDNNTVEVVNNDQTIYGTSASEKLEGDVGNDTIMGYGGEDTLVGNAGDDSLNGGAGKDFLIGGEGNDTLDGGDWDFKQAKNFAVYSHDPGGVTVDINYTQDGSSYTYSGTAVDGYGNTDTLINIDRIYGSDYADDITVTMNDVDDSMNTRFYIWGNDGADTITGTDGERVRAMYLDDPSGVNIDLGAGTAVDGWGNTDILTNINAVSGTDYVDTLTGSNESEGFIGTLGNDTILGLDGEWDWVSYYWGVENTSVAKMYIDLASGEAIGKDSSGNHIFTDSLSSIESVWGSFGDDTIYGDATTRELAGDAGDDLLIGGHTASDHLEQFYGGQGDDTLDGGEGYFDGTHPKNLVDYSYYDGGSGVDVNVQYLWQNASGTYTGTATDTYGDTDTLKWINRFVGSDHDDSFTIDIDDADGDSEVRWYVWGGDGADTITGTSGERVRAMYLDDPGAVTIDLAAGTVVDGWGNIDTLTDISQVSGSHDGNDVLNGASTDDLLIGSLGDDTLNGRAGWDTASYSWLDSYDNVSYVEGDIWDGQVQGFDSSGNLLFTDTISNIESLEGTVGNDELSGSSGDDCVHGWDGNDTLDGNAGGNDYLEGGSGSDTFLLTHASGLDNIMDFGTGTSEKIVAVENSLWGGGGSRADGTSLFGKASSGGTSLDPVDYKVIAVLDTCSSDFSDAASYIDGAVNDAGMDHGGADQTYFIISNGTDSRVYYWDGDTDHDYAVEDNELTLLAHLDGVDSLSSWSEGNVDVVENYS